MRFVLLFAVAAMSASANAQEITAPRYEALEQQLQMLEQREFNTLERERMNTIIAPPSSTETQAQRALRRLDIEQRQRELILRGEQERALTARERAITEAGIPNRRIAPSSVLVVSEPAAYGLPALPRGKYYARLDGRFVVVDGASELVERILPVQPTDPTADIPAQPRPPLSPPIPADRP